FRKQKSTGVQMNFTYWIHARRVSICKSLFFLAANIVILTSSESIGRAERQLDQYGGYKDIPCTAGQKPHFYTEKINNRWWLCTPAGNAFFIKGIYHVE